MSYEEWLDIIDKIDKSSVNISLLDKIKNEKINENIQGLLAPKLENLIIKKFENATMKIKSDLDNIFSDENYLDYILVNFKKEISYIIELIKIPQILADKKVNLTYKIIEGTNSIYDVLIKEADIVDSTGVMSMMIKSNRIKWSD